MNAALFFSGITMITFAASAFFFLKFWRASGDRFFLLFGFACAMLSLERVFALFVPVTMQTLPDSLDQGNWIYLFRLIAFSAIMAGAIYRKFFKEDT